MRLQRRRNATRSFERLSSRKKRSPRTARLSLWAGVLWLGVNKSCSAEREPLLLDPVLCELGKVDRRKKSRENREQLRCCNWIRLPIGPIVKIRKQRTRCPLSPQAED